MQSLAGKVQEDNMGRRQQNRFRIALPVTVSGLDTKGNPFTQSATTVDISPRGVRLRGIRCLRGRGDPIVVFYKNKKAPYRVVWIGQPGTCDEDLAGLEGLEGAKFIFAEHLPPSSYSMVGADPDTYSGDAAAAATAEHAAIEITRESDRHQKDRRQVERRRHPRFICAGTARIWENGQKHDVKARINEISFCGCYVEMMSPMRIGQAIRMELAVDRRTICLEGVVRTAQPNFGMGVEFIKMVPAEAEKLHRLLGELSGESPAEATPPAEPPVPRPDDIPGKQLSEALLRWFGLHDALTRQEFLGILEKLKRSEELSNA